MSTAGKDHWYGERSPWTEQQLDYYYNVNGPRSRAAKVVILGYRSSAPLSAHEEAPVRGWRDWGFRCVSIRGVEAGYRDRQLISPPIVPGTVEIKQQSRAKFSRQPSSPFVQPSDHRFFLSGFFFDFRTSAP
jgi:hypothetical protein